MTSAPTLETMREEDSDNKDAYTNGQSAKTTEEVQVEEVAPKKKKKKKKLVEPESTLETFTETPKKKLKKKKKKKVEGDSSADADMKAKRECSSCGGNGDSSSDEHSKERKHRPSIKQGWSLWSVRADSRLSNATTHSNATVQQCDLYTDEQSAKTFEEVQVEEVAPKKKKKLAERESTLETLTETPKKKLKKKKKKQVEGDSSADAPSVDSTRPKKLKKKKKKKRVIESEDLYVSEAPIVSEVTATSAPTPVPVGENDLGATTVSIGSEMNVTSVSAPIPKDEESEAELKPGTDPQPTPATAESSGTPTASEGAALLEREASNRYSNTSISSISQLERTSVIDLQFSKVFNELARDSVNAGLVNESDRATIDNLLTELQQYEKQLQQERDQLAKDREMMVLQQESVEHMLEEENEKTQRLEARVLELENILDTQVHQQDNMELILKVKTLEDEIERQEEALAKMAAEHREVLKRQTSTATEYTLSMKSFTGNSSTNYLPEYDDENDYSSETISNLGQLQGQLLQLQSSLSRKDNELEEKTKEIESLRESEAEKTDALEHAEIERDEAMRILEAHLNTTKLRETALHNAMTSYGTSTDSPTEVESEYDESEYEDEESSLYFFSGKKESNEELSCARPWLTPTT